MKSLMLATLVALCLCGCGTPKQTHTQTSPVFSQGVSVEERSAAFYKGRPRAIRPDEYLARVDYQSELRILLDTNQLNKALPPVPDVLPPLTADEESKLESLTNLLQAAQNFVQVLSVSGPSYSRIMAGPAGPDRDQRRMALIQTEARAETNLLKQVIAYGTARVRAENPAFNNSQVIQARDAMFKSIIVLNPKQLISVDIVQLSAFIAAERDAILSNASEHAKAVREAGSVFLRMRASLWSPDQGETTLHIRNYDVLSDADVTQEPRISFKMSEDDRKRLAAETQVYSDIAKLSTDLQNGKSEIRQSLDSIVNALRGDMASWKEALTNFSNLQQKLEPVIAALDKANASGQLNADQKKIVADARQLFGTVTNQIQTVRDTLKLFVQPVDPNADPATVLLGSVDALSRGLDSLKDFPADIAVQIDGTLADLQKLVADLQAAIPQDTPHLQDVADLFKAGAPDTAAAITNLVEVTLKNYPALVAEIGSLRRKSQVVAAASKLPPISIDPNLLDIAVVNPPDGFISLRKNVVRGDATVTLDAALITRHDSPATPSTTPSESKPVAHQEFAVEKFGLINTWSANLIFVKRLGDLGPNERKVQFSPAPSISWTLHYNPPPDLTTEFQPRNKFWGTLDPGIGLNIAALNWDNGVQLGLGGHVSIFHDLLSAGGGYNLNESHHGAYVFIGLGLFQALNQLGITGANFPLGR